MAMDGGFEGTGPASGGWEDTGAPAGAGNTHALPDPQKLAQDWITLWQSEMSAMAADPELRESWQTVIGLWAGTMAAMLRGLPRTHGHDGTAGQTRPADAPRPTPAAAASDARDAEIERLARHVATLERRLADLERGSDSASRPKRGAGRKRRT